MVGPVKMRKMYMITKLSF